MVVWEASISLFPALSHIDQDHLVISSAESHQSDCLIALAQIANLSWKIQIAQASVRCKRGPVGYLQLLAN